jgi:hypothetical protein
MTLLAFARCERNTEHITRVQTQAQTEETDG